MSDANGFLLWDMAGTLVPFDPITGRAQALPGLQDHLPELARQFDMVVTTGDGTASARGTLANFELLPHFCGVYGDLFSRVGKPYGEILRELRGDPRRSLAIGDRLSADVPADTGDLVTLLVNQNGDIVSAGLIAYLIAVMCKYDEEFPAAFGKLCQESEPVDEPTGPAQGGEVVQAWRRNDGFDYQLWLFEHAVLDSARMVIVI